MGRAAGAAVVLDSCLNAEMSDDLLPEEDDVAEATPSGDEKRTLLAGERTYLAGERTLLAWVRTSVAMMGFGFLVARFGLFLRELAQMRSEEPDHVAPSAIIGTALVVVGALVNVYAIFEHAQFLSRFHEERAKFARRSLVPLLLASAMSALGVALAWYLVAVD